MTTRLDPLPELRALNLRFIHNFVTNDVAAHDAMLHQGFTAITPAGGHVDRQTYLRNWSRGFDPAVIVYWDMRDERIAIFGDTALVRATNKWIRKVDAGLVAGMTCYTDTYVRFGDRWLCIQAQLTSVDAANQPPDSTIACQYHRGVPVPPGSAFDATAAPPR